MKKLFVLFMTFLVITTMALSLSACKTNPYSDCIRIHIRANSNSEPDQNLKYKVRDSIVAYLTPLLSEATDKSVAYSILHSHLADIEQVGDARLAQEGSKYMVTATLKKEKFPARVYGDMVFEDGIYDALIINIGTGKGDNWWCVAFPPLCFVGEADENTVYRSKILEIIKEYKKR